MDGPELDLLVEPNAPAERFGVPHRRRHTIAASCSTKTSGPAPVAYAAVLPARRFRYLLPAIALFAALAFAIAAVAAPTDADHVIVPGNATKTDSSAPAGSGTGAFTFVAVLLLAGAGAWLVWRGRGAKFLTLDRSARRLAIEETRSLGSRQYLVVATYQEKKFLLGVCPGRIDLLAPLHEGADPVPSKERA